MFIEEAKKYLGETKMDTKLISAFPGCGKTTFFNSVTDAIDSDSSNFSWISVDGEKTRNPKFPENYIEHIQSELGKHKYIFISSHKEVRDALKKAGLFFYLVYPNIELKDEYIQRYRDRKSPESFVSLLEKNWENWIGELDKETGCEKYVLKSGEFLSDALKEI